jgi:hypothetical protein
MRVHPCFQRNPRVILLHQHRGAPFPYGIDQVDCFGSLQVVNGQRRFFDFSGG